MGVTSRVVNIAKRAKVSTGRAGRSADELFDSLPLIGRLNIWKGYGLVTVTFGLIAVGILLSASGLV